jgi:hypothetical protein
MVAVERRNTLWYGVFLVLMVAVGLCAVGYWQTYDKRCFGGTRQWSWTEFPPQFVCSSGF